MFVRATERVDFVGQFDLGQCPSQPVLVLTLTGRIEVPLPLYDLKAC